ncbi:MAG: glycosyltransferase family 4 protein [Desulfosoma sp.]
MRIFVIGGTARSLVNFRGPLIRELLELGHEVFACAGEPEGDAVRELGRWGVEFIPTPIVRAGMNPWKDLRSFASLYQAMRRIRPDIALTYTIKPIVWGGLAARWARVRACYSMVTGLGYAFGENNGLKARFARLAAKTLYGLSLKGSRQVFFQNPDDLNEFCRLRLVSRKQCVLINGSGVDVRYFAWAPLPRKMNFLMICRLLRDKGLHEYVQAAKIVRALYPEAHFALAGPRDSNPAGISTAELDEWQREGVITYLGELHDVRPALAACSVYVLPSYREGTPRTVLEAMSMGRPIITTNAPGCRETVLLPPGQRLDKDSEDIIWGENGFLVPVRNVEKLAEAMLRFCDNPALIPRMGRRSREIAEEKYDVRKVNAVIMQVMGLG